MKRDAPPLKNDEYDWRRVRAPARPAVGPKLVFGHYMLCFQAFSSAYPNPTHSAADVPGYIEEIALAQHHGLDGFALEYGFSARSQPFYNASLHYMFEACEQYNTQQTGRAPFYLIPILDFDADNTSTRRLWHETVWPSMHYDRTLFETVTKETHR